MLSGYYLDIEADSFYLFAKKVWYIKFKSLDKKRELSVHPFRDPQAKDKMLEWINSFEDGCYVVGHNFLGFDAWIMWKFFDIKPVVGKKGKDYLICGLMMQRTWERFSIYANFENFTDRRQTRFDTIYTGSMTKPEFRDIYAPLDGFVLNAGIIIKL